MILDLWGISFHAVVVVGLGIDLLPKSVLGHCEYYVVNTTINMIYMLKVVHPYLIIS
jgi:hypothetical protein